MNDVTYAMPWMSSLCSPSAFIPTNGFAILAGCIEIALDQNIEIGIDSLLVIL